MPSVINQEIVNELESELGKLASMALAEFDKVPVKNLESLRRELDAKKTQCQVMKNRLLRVVLKKKGIDLPESCYQGASLAVYSDGEITYYVKILVDFSKKNETMKIKGGIMNNKFLSKEDVVAISKLPSREVLIATMLGTLNAPISNFVNVLNGVLRNFVCVIKAIEDKKKAEGK